MQYNMPYSLANAVHAFPDHIKNTIYEVHHRTGAPMEFCALTAVATMSAAMHGFVIRTPRGDLMPTSLYCMGLGPTKSGKSAAMRELFRPIREFDMELAERREMSDEAASAPALRDLLYSDVTSTSLLEVLDGTGLSATIADEDCVDLLSRDVMTKRGRLNRLFDGSPKESARRRNADLLVARSPALNICCFTQPEIYTEHLTNTRHKDRKTGLAQRFLYAVTTEKCGSGNSTMPTPYLDAFHCLIRWLLEQRAQRLLAGDPSRIELELGTDAIECWNRIQNDLEVRLYSAPPHVVDSAARALEKTWRVAAQLHVYTSLPLPASLMEPIPDLPPIPAACVQAAWPFVLGAMEEYQKVFAPPPLKMPKGSRVKERQLEQTLVAKRNLFEHLMRSGSTVVPKDMARDLMGLSSLHIFKMVLANMKSAQLVIEREGKDSVLEFSAAFFAEMSLDQAMHPPVVVVPQLMVPAMTSAYPRSAFLNSWSTMTPPGIVPPQFGEPV